MNIVYLAWAPYNRRAVSFAQRLDAEACFIHYFQYQRMQWAFAKYPIMAVKTLWVLFRKRPDAVIVMSPPLFAALFAYLCCTFQRRKLVIDAHTGSLISKPWTHFAFLHRFLCRRAVCTVVTNNHLAELVRSWGGKTLVMSPPVQIPSLCPSPFKIRTPAFLVVNAFSSDEPLEEILKAVARFPGYHFYVSGRKAKAPSTVLDRENEHIHFTDFLSENDYYLLMQRSLAVICLTTRDHTLQSGGEEALYMGKPLLTSDFRALREFFFKGTVFVQPEASSIADGVKRLTAAHRSLSAEMRDLQACYLSDWRTKQARLLNWLQREG